MAGLDWVAANARSPAVVMMSLGVGKGQWSQALERATRSLILDYNITVVVASGNSRTNSCSIVPGDRPGQHALAPTAHHHACTFQNLMRVVVMRKKMGFAELLGLSGMAGTQGRACQSSQAFIIACSCHGAST